MNCSDAPLLQLLESNGNLADAARFSDVERHLESCVACRRRLEALAADDGCWSDLSTSLIDEPLPTDAECSAAPTGSNRPTSSLTSHSSLSSHSSVLAVFEPSLDADLPAVCDVVSLDFLGPPRHPELLGHLGRYDIEQLVGSGGMGVVLKAFDSQLHRYVAVKTLAPHLAGSGAARRRFEREAQAAAAIAHPNVMPIHDVQSSGPAPYLVMPLFTGRSLQDWVDREGSLTVEESLRVLCQTAAALEAAHARGIIHRDVKPGNILIEEGGRVLLSDFGLARAADEAGLTRTGVLAGTPQYMSPEQALGEPLDDRSDLFSLGSVLYFMLSGKTPFCRDGNAGTMGILLAICHHPHLPIDHHRAGLADEVIALSESLLAKQPVRRPPGAGAVRAACELLIRERRFHASRLPGRNASPSIHPGRGAWLTAAACAALVVVAALLSAFHERPRSGDDSLDHNAPGATQSELYPPSDAAPAITVRPLPLSGDELNWQGWDQELSEAEGIANELWSENAPAAIESYGASDANVDAFAAEIADLQASVDARANQQASEIEGETFADPLADSVPSAWEQSRSIAEAQAQFLEQWLRQLLAGPETRFAEPDVDSRQEVAPADGTDGTDEANETDGADGANRDEDRGSNVKTMSPTKEKQ
ncbi:MAG: serine/threonine protein kinase [Planctomycetales bacterium]|nr:serine/threonine protein kinase [Planctomycetales bacterium]